MDPLSRYSVVGIQTANPSASDRSDVQKNLKRMLELADCAFEGYSELGFPIKLVVFPEFALQGVGHPTRKAMVEHGIPVGIPGPELEAFVKAARRHDTYIVTGTFLEEDPRWPAHLFNTACLVGPEGLILKYRKVNTWIPLEFFTSPHSLQGYHEEMFPVAHLPIGRVAVGVCYDYLFPEVFREYAVKGAEVLVRCSAYMPPFTSELPTNWWTLFSQVRSIENVAYGIHVNQGAALRDFPPFSWPGGTCVVDYQGRILSQISESGEHLVYGSLDLESLRAWRARAYTHLMPAHLRTEAFTYLKKSVFPPATFSSHQECTPEALKGLIDGCREALGYRPGREAAGALSGAPPPSGRA